MLKRLLPLCSVLLVCWGVCLAEPLQHRGQNFLVYRVNPQTDQLALFWKDPEGQRFGSFRRLREHLSSNGQELKFAMNAGIFGVDYAPLGLHIEKSRHLHALDLGKGGRGNFYLKPNGVFYIANHKPAIVDARTYPKIKVKPQLATQSGPLLVINGTLHPAFREESSNRHFRNGVGVTREGKVVFAISRGLVTFHEFATLFRDVLDCPNALYLDGALSAMYAPDLGLTFSGGDFAGILAVTQ
ncbi:MAG: phosphodiester glycosidase family protein [Candidatus Binatia bacterium]